MLEVWVLLHAGSTPPREDRSQHVQGKLHVWEHGHHLAVWPALGIKKTYPKPTSHTCSVFSISPLAQKLHTFLLEIAEDGENQLNTISSYFHKATSTGISHRIQIDITSSVLVKTVLAQLSLVFCRAMIWGKKKTFYFLGVVNVKTWNPDDVEHTSTTSGWNAAFRKLFLQTNFMLAL